MEADVPCYCKQNRQGSRCAPLLRAAPGLRLELSKAGEKSKKGNKAPATLPLRSVVRLESSGAAGQNEKIQLGSKDEATQSMPSRRGGLPKVPAPSGTSKRPGR